MRHLSLIVGLHALISASTAHAQVSTPVRYNEGPGVKLSDGLVFHPGIAVEGRYDSNVLFQDSELKGAPYLRLIGHISLATTSPQRRTDGSGRVAPQTVAFNLKASLAYREYLSGEDRVTNQRGLGVLGDASLRWSPSRHFELHVSDSFSRTVLAQQPIAAEASQSLAQDLNRLNLRANIIPGGGRLSFSVGYAFDLNAFEDDGFDVNNRLGHEIAVLGKFKLLPMTAVTLEVIQQFMGYTADNTLNEDSMPIRAYAGFVGLLTPRLSTILKVGYGNSIHASDDSYSSVLAKAELGYAVGPRLKLKVGYDRSFSDSIYGNYLDDNRVYLGYDQMISEKFLLHADASYTFRSLGGLSKVNATALDQHIVALALAFDYQIQEWVYLGVGYDLHMQNLSSPVADAGAVFGAADYVRHQVYAKVGISY